MTTQSWREHAACKGLPVEIFFPIGNQPRNGQQVCAGCEVRQECLDYALAEPELFGIWGGLTTDERVRPVRKLRSEPTLDERPTAERHLLTVLDDFDLYHRGNVSPEVVEARLRRREILARIDAELAAMDAEEASAA